MGKVLNWFKCKFPFTCDKCGDKCEAGDWATYVDQHLVCEGCGREAEGEDE